MSEQDKGIDKNNFNPELKRQDRTEFYTSYAVPFTPENAQNVAGLLNRIMAWEIGQGIRSETNDPQTMDNLDKLQRQFMIVSCQKFQSSILLSKGKLTDIKNRFDNYVSAEGLSEDKVGEYRRALLTMEVSLSNVMSITPHVEEQTIQQFRFGPKSIGDWLRKRAERGSRDGLG